MVNKFYVSGEERAARVNDLFAAVAPRYDLINDLQSFGLHRLWKRQLVRLARVRTGEYALDLGCGTGDVAFSLARGGATVIGVDFSAPMLAVARTRAASRRRPAVQLLQGDALRLPFAAGQFDVVTISYALRNLASFEGGIVEMLRVLRVGGRLLVLDFGKPDQRLWRAPYFAYLRRVVPIFGRLFCGDSATHGYILESLERYPAQRGVAALMEEMACNRVRIVNFLGGMMSINYGEKSAAVS